MPKVQFAQLVRRDDERLRSDRVRVFQYAHIGQRQN